MLRRRAVKQVPPSHPLAGKKIWIPRMSYGSARAFAAALPSIGVEAEWTPPSPQRAGKKSGTPRMSYGSARAFAAAFRSIGIDAECTPASDERTRALGGQ